MLEHAQLLNLKDLHLMRQINIDKQCRFFDKKRSSVRTRCWKAFIKLPENMTFSLETYPYRLLSALRFVYFGKLLQKHLLFELHVILSEFLFVSEFRKSANDRLDFKFYLLLQERVRALLDANIYAEILIHLFKRRKAERAQVKQIRTRGCFNRGHASINMTKTLKCRWALSNDTSTFR